MTHVDLSGLQPRSYKALNALSATAEEAAREAGLDELLVELIKLRASQLNGCAYCLRMHAADAAAKGETPERLAVLAAWWESQYFSDVEQAALALTEQITGTAAHREIGDVLDVRQYAAVSWLAIVINAYNRLAVTSHLPVAP